MQKSRGQLHFRPLGGEWQDASLSSLQSGEEGDIEIRYHGVMGRILRDRFGWVMEVPNLTAPAPSWEVAGVQTVSILKSRAFGHDGY